MTLQWKQRLYAFLLRRILGPYLTPSSNAKLHQSIDVSLNEGAFILKDVDLDPTYLTSLLLLNVEQSEEGSNKKGGMEVVVKRAKVKKLGIYLSLKGKKELQEEEERLQQQQQNGGNQQQQQQDGAAASSSTKIVRNLYQLGIGNTDSDKSSSSNSGGGGVTLLAHFEIEGVSIEFMPAPPHASFKSTPQTPQKEKTSSSRSSGGGGGMFSSYIDAALRSLRLSLQIKDVAVKMYSRFSSKDSKPCWVGVRLASLHYYDLLDKQKQEMEYNDTLDSSMDSRAQQTEVVLYKAVDVQDLSVETGYGYDVKDEITHDDDEEEGKEATAETTEKAKMGSSSKTKPVVIAQTDGMGQIRFRVLAFPQSSSSSQKETSTPPRLQRDIEVALHQRFSVNLNITSLDNIKRVMMDLYQPEDDKDDTFNEEKMIKESTTQLRNALGGVVGENAASPKWVDYTPDDDNNDSHSETSDDDPYKQIMKQYAEARHLARTREVRGGILVPTISFNDGDDDENGIVTFDTFFDANDQSFCTYKSMMYESTASMTGGLGGADDWDGKGQEDSSFVETKLIFHLQEGSVKLCFDDDSLDEGSTMSPGGQQQQHDIIMGAGYVNAKEYALATFGDCNISLAQSNARSDIDINIAYFAIDDSVYALTNLNETTGQSCIEIGSLFRFIEPYDEEEDEVGGSGEGGNYVVDIAPAPCCCVHIEKRHCRSSGVDGYTDECKIDLTLQPIEIIYRESTVRHLSNMAKSLSTTASNEVSKGSKANTNAERKSTKHQTDTENLTRMNFFASLPTLTLLIPFDDDPISSLRTDSPKLNYAPLFDRCSYTIPNAVCAQRASLGLTVDGISIETSNMGCLPSDVGDCNDSDDNGFSAALICNHAIIFAESPIIEERGVSGLRNQCIVGTKRVDLLACSNESEIESQAVLKFHYHFNDRKHKARQGLSPNATNPFPLIPPLSSVKARQQYEPDDADDMNEEESSSPFSENTNDQKIRGSDPQYAMSSEAGECDSHVEIHIPHLALDLTLQERQTFLNILSVLGTSGQEAANQADDPDARVEQKSAESDGTTREPFGLALNFGQLCIALHGEKDKRTCANQLGNKESRKREDDDNLSYIMIVDQVRSHFLVHSSGLRNVRISSHDLTLYEASNFLAEQDSTAIVGSLETSAQDRCKKVRRRCRKNPRTISKPIFHRSNLGCPLSPEMPAFLVDVLFRHASDESFYDGEERTIHLSVYDVTYRYDIDSCWFNRFLCVLQGRHYDEIELDEDEPMSVHESEACETQNGINTAENDSNVPSLTNLFVTFADCVVDYTSPRYFKCASRSLLRVGEMRLSSNIITPAGPAQVYKVSLGDVAMHICNHRFSYNTENARLSCSANLLREEDLLPDNETKNIDLRGVVSAEDILQRMGFIAVIHLDSVDALLASANNEVAERSNTGPFIGAKKSIQQRPNLTMTLSFGQASIYTCRDSFSCLTDTFGEWLLKYTALSQEEMERLRAADGFSGHAAEKCGENAESERKGQIPPIHSKTQKFDGMENNVMSQSSSMYEVMGNDMFMESDGDGKILGKMEVIDTNEKESNPTDSNSENPFSDIPDSELSATELRQKYSMVQNDDVSIGFAKTPLIKNFYTIETASRENTGSHGVYRESATHDKFSEEKNALKHEDPNAVHSSEAGLLLGGHSWTTVDHEWSRSSNIPPEMEQNAQWYSSPNESNCDSLTNFMQKKRCGKQTRKINIFPQHVPINPVSDPLSGGDMNAKKFAGTPEPPHVRVRVIIKHLSVNARFFDGFDWQIRPKSKIAEKDRLYNQYMLQATRNKASQGEVDPRKIEMMEARAEMMGSLLEEGSMFADEKKTFEHHPLPEERGEMLQEAAVQRSQSRRSDQYFQFSISGLKLRQDSFIETPEHDLSSCMDLTMADFFIAETISGNKPVKMFGEWLNESEHPRDSNDDLVMMKMVSMRPTSKISADGKLMSDESRVTMELLPLRFFLHQTALRFVKKFFSGDERDHGLDNTVDCSDEMPDDIPGVFFQVFKVKPCKLKVDYLPEKVDLDALKHGSYIEIINLMPLNDMVLMLEEVRIRDMTGWGTVAAETFSRWLGDICSTQMHKFLTRSAPFQPIVNLGGGMADLVIVPVEEVRQGEKLGKAVKKGTSTFAGKVAYDAVNTTSKLSKYTAKLTNRAASKLVKHNSMPMPSRPDRVPRNVRDTAGHAYESLSRGLKEANHKVIILPYREWERNGPAGAARSVLKGIPVAVLAPISGASEALSYAALGLRNQMRPDVRVEEEAWRRGLQSDF